MNAARKLIVTATAAIFLFMNSGCTEVKWRTLQEERVREDTGLREDHGQPVAGYTLADGTYHPYRGRVYLISADSLAFRSARYSRNPPARVQRQRDPDAEKARAEQRYALADVVELQVVQSPGLGTVIVEVTATLVVLAVIALATKESCPFLYSWDGEQYVFDGEPYGGATMSSLQRTDFSELEHLRADAGDYRLRIGNEVDETQHTDALQLLVADHPVGTRAVMDRDGVLHCFRDLVELNAAYDESGKDLSVWLRAKDNAGWSPDLAAFAAQDSLLDTRNHITIEFPRPRGRDRVHLVANVGTGQWGSHMIRMMLSLRGNQVGAFYDAINTSLEYRQQLAAWNEREDLFALDVEVQVGTVWERRGALHGGGPFISELRAIPLDLTGVEGETVRLRLHPPIGFWRFDAFYLGIDDVPGEIARLPIATATDSRGEDVLALLAAEDGASFDQPTKEDWAELTFKAPPVRVDRDRTIFAVTSGWYGIHLYAEEPPDSVRLQRLAFEPGYAVRLAMEEYAEFTRTGRLGYIKPIAAMP